MRLVWLITALLLLTAQEAAATDPIRLFEAEVEVADSGQAQRSVGIVAAFAAVVTKVTGRSQPQEFAAWPRLSEAASGLVLQYRYRSEEPQPGLVAESIVPRTLLWIQFDHAGVERLLRSEQLPVWGVARPATLLLVAVEDGTNRFLFTPEALPALDLQLSTAAARRAIPLILPLMDLEDNAALRFTDVWAGFVEVLWQGAARYQPDALLVVRLFRQAGTRWAGQWTLHLAGATQGWETSGTLDDLVGAGIDEAANRLATHFVPDPLDSDLRYRVRVTGVMGATDFARVTGYFSGLTAVVSVRVAEIQRDAVELELVARVSPESLDRILTLGGMLDAAVAVTANGVTTAAYRLRP